MKVTPEPLHMKRVVAEATYRLKNTVEEYEAEVVLPEAWPKALGFAPWIEEVWVNYLSNALKYGGRPPRIELGADAESDGWVRFWVRDNGRGIAAEEQSKLFIPFTQLHTVDVESHGLGLSIVQGIVEKLGGSVAVESEVGQGSTFSFTLPATPVLPKARRASRQLEETSPIQEACTRAA
jgi:signal transduction histidine kinase